MFYAGTQERLLRGSWLYEDHRLRVPILNCGGSRIEERDSEEGVLWYWKMNSALCASRIETMLSSTDALHIILRWAFL